jgi:hypothetical protein
MVGLPPIFVDSTGWYETLTPTIQHFPSYSFSSAIKNIILSGEGKNARSAHKNMKQSQGELSLVFIQFKPLILYNSNLYVKQNRRHVPAYDLRKHCA